MENREIKKGTTLKVKHNDRQYGTFTGIAMEDFNTDDEWYSIAVAVSGKGLLVGEEIECRRGFCEREIIKEPPCETCVGSGTVSTMERVYPNEPHTADVGSEPCPTCNSRGVDDSNWEE